MLPISDVATCLGVCVSPALGSFTPQKTSCYAMTNLWRSPCEEELGNPANSHRMNLDMKSIAPGKPSADCSIGL